MIEQRIKLLEDIANATAELHEKCRLIYQNPFSDLHRKILIANIAEQIEQPLLALQEFDKENVNA